MSSCASLIVRKVSVDVKQNLKKKKKAGFFSLNYLYSVRYHARETDDKLFSNNLTGLSASF